MDNLNQHIVHAGWLIKSPPEKRIWKTKWRRRWFILKLSGQIPGQYVLEYFTDSTCKKLKGQIDLDQCEQVDAGLQLEIRKQNYDNMFDLRTSKRIYYLVAGSEEEMNKWVECICAVCGLKMETIQNELSLLPSLDNEERYSPQPSQPEQQQIQNQQHNHHNQSHQQQQQSTSESSLSTLNYIPISECYTGKPSQSPPPPRPPKPASFSKSQSSLALWPQDQVQGQSTQSQPPQSRSSPTKIPSPAQVFPQMTTSNVLNMSVNNNNNLLQKPLISMSTMMSNSNQNNPNFNNRSFYLNSMNNNNNNMTSYNQSFNIYDTWHSKSKKSDFIEPPLVNRDLKPNRRRILEQQQNNHQQKQHQPSNQHLQMKSDSGLNPNMKQPFKNINSSQSFTNSRHTLPRLLIQRYTSKNNENKAKNNNTNTNNNNNYSHLTYCEQPKTIEDSERQYLDLDLDCETNNNSNSNSNSPRLSNNNDLNVPNTINTNNNNMNNNNNNNGTMQIDSMSIITSNHSNWNIPTINNLLATITPMAKLPQTISEQQQPDILPNNNNVNNNSTNLVNILNDNKISMGNSSSNNNNNNNITGGISIPDNSGTVYKKVDFLKTKAFNEMRLNVNMYRNSN